MLHITYRPTSLDDVVGQEQAVESLTAVLDRDIEKIPHALLFSGPSGCGKTTLGRIFATEMECGGMDFQEIDSASFTGVDAVRDIRRKMRMGAISGDVRIWLLDEVHRMSKAAQDALLKALEDPPDHVYFVLCTTEPKQLLKTVVNRCLHFQLKSVAADSLTGLLQSVCKQEKVKIDEEYLELIADYAEGSPRKALTTLDKVIDLDPEDIEDHLSEGEEDAAVIDLCRALLGKSNWKKVSKILRGITEDPESVRRAVLGYANSVLIKSANERAFLIIDIMQHNLYDSGKAGLTAYCYAITTTK